MQDSSALVDILNLKFVISLTFSFISLGSIPILWNFVIKSYQKDRIISFLNPESDPLGRGYQLIQSKIALGSGGMTGKGFLQGSQSYLDYLPEKQTDFIFTLFSEEVTFDKNDQTAVSKSTSKFESKGTEIISEGFSITEKGDIILFNGKTSLILKQ